MSESNEEKQTDLPPLGGITKIISFRIQAATSGRRLSTAATRSAKIQARTEHHHRLKCTELQAAVGPLLCIHSAHISSLGGGGKWRLARGPFTPPKIFLHFWIPH